VLARNSEPFEKPILALLLRRADGTNSVIKSLAWEIRPFLRCALAVPHLSFGSS
jgi:hypothetical protein